MKTFKELVELLEEVGFREMTYENYEEDSGYYLKSNKDIEVYLKRGYLNIHLTPKHLNLEFYKLESQIFYYQEKFSRSRSWYFTKKMVYIRDDKGIKAFRDLLLLSVCRDSFLDPEEEEKMDDRRPDEFYIDKDWHDWYL